MAKDILKSWLVHTATGISGILAPGFFIDLF